VRTPESGPPTAVPAGLEYFDLLPIGLAEYSADGTCRRVNVALRRLVRHPEDDPQIRNLTELGWTIVGKDRAAVAELIAAADAGSGAGRLLHLVHEDGSELFVRTLARRTPEADRGQGSVLVVVADVTAEVRAERALAESERRLRLAFEASPDGWALLTVGRDAATPGVSRIIRRALLNARARELTTWSEEELPGHELCEVLGAQGTDLMRRLVTAALEYGESSVSRTPLELAGERRVLDSSVVRLDPETVLCRWRDVTDVVDAEALLSRAYEETAEMRSTLQTALDSTSDGFAIYQLEWDDARSLVGMRVVHANAAGAESLGLDPESMIGMELHEFFSEVESTGLWDRIVTAVLTKEPQRHRVQLYDEDGRWRAAWDNTVAPVGEERLAITWRDASKEERAIRQLARTRDEAMYSATHDALTDLPNRVLLRQHLTEALAACRPDERVGLVFVDLDRFKVINDTYGHAAGDVVLKATAARLGQMVRHGDLAARLAGDEFVLVLTGLAPDWDPEHFFARARAQLFAPVRADGVELRPSASLGLVLADPHREHVDVDDLVKRADAEMYKAKAAARR
jgi:diguanylate cyclase (GGDEF)-like protein